MVAIAGPWLLSLNTSRSQQELVMIAMPAVLWLLKSTSPNVPTVIFALAAVLELLTGDDSVPPLPVLMVGALEELLTMPAPLNSVCSRRD